MIERTNHATQFRIALLSLETANRQSESKRLPSKKNDHYVILIGPKVPLRHSFAYYGFVAIPLRIGNACPCVVTINHSRCYYPGLAENLRLSSAYLIDSERNPNRDILH